MVDSRVAWCGLFGLVLSQAGCSSELSPSERKELVRSERMPLALEPKLGAETAVDSVSEKVPYWNDNSGAAYNGAHYLVTWVDNRSHTEKIWLNRVSPDLSAMDGQGFPLPTGLYQALKSEVASDGDQFLVVWSGRLRLDTAANTALFATVVNAEGLVVTTTPIATGNGIGSFAVTWSGSHYTLAWTSAPGGVYAARVTSEGTLLDPGGNLVSAGLHYGSLALASDGSSTIGVVNDSTFGSAGVYRFFLDDQADLLAGSLQPLAVVGSNLAQWRLAWGGENYFLAGTQSSFSGGKVWGARVAADGQALGSLIEFGEGQPVTSVASNGDGFMVAWRELNSFNLRLVGIGSDGVFQGGSSVAAAGESAGLASDGEGYFATISKDNKFMALGYDSAGALLDTGIIVEPSDSQLVPAVGAGVNESWVTWLDSSEVGPYSAPNFPRGARLSAAGEPFGSTLLLAASGDYMRAVAAANAQSTFLSVWSFEAPGTSADLQGRLVSDAGTVGAPIMISAPTNVNHSEGEPDVISTGTEFMVVWSEVTNVDSYSIRARRIAQDGTKSPVTIVGPANAGSRGAPSVAWDGERYLFTWLDAPSYGASTKIHATLMGAGDALEASDVPLVASADVSDVEVAASGEGEFLVAWCERPLPSVHYGTLKVASYDGSTLGAVQTYGDNVTGLNLVWGGRQYLLAYQVFDVEGSDWNVEVLRLNESGEALGSALGAATSAVDEVTPSLSTSGNERYVLAYSKYDSALGTMRVQSRVLTHLLEQGDSCESDRDCETDHCIDGVCCESACGGGSTTDCMACSAAAGSSTDGVCGPVTGSVCTSDNLCLSNTVCNAGACEGTALACTVSDQCHAAGTCDPSTGVCSDPLAQDGTACELEGEEASCQAGLCVASSEPGAGGAGGDPSGGNGAAGASDAGEGGTPGAGAGGSSSSDGGSMSSGGSPSSGGGSGASTAGGDSSSGGSSVGSGDSPDHESDGGCGCRLESTRGGTRPALGAALMALLVLRRRRQARRS